MRVEALLLVLTLGVGNCAGINRNVFSLFRITHSLVASASSPECKDGVCSLPPQNNTGKVRATVMSLSGGDDSSQDRTAFSGVKIVGDKGAATVETVNDPVDIDAKVEELMKLGWPKEESLAALRANDYDVANAGSQLDIEQEERERLLKEIQKFSEEYGWALEASEASLQQAGWNSTLANEYLCKEEEEMVNQFDKAVKEMMENGWEEIVARQALLAQWSLDRRKALGFNNTVSAEVLQSYKPTLRKSNETDAATSKTPAKNTSKGSSLPGSDKNLPKPAKREDVVLDINSNNLQKLVLESDVPVLLDIYADWCGPCKQLGPILEEAAIKSGGMFKLGKVNSDQNRAISEALGVTGLPTVFSVVKGKLTDRFVGMLPGDQLQKFVVRLITGYGERVQDNISEPELHTASQKLSSLAGLASISFQKKEKINKLVDEALDRDLGIVMVNGKPALSEGVKTVMTYLTNCRGDIRNDKFRVISMDSKTFTEKIVPSPAAVRLLEVAGYRERDDGTSATREDSRPKSLELLHNNVAILQLILQRIDHTLSQRKFAKIKGSPVILGGKSATTYSKAATAASNSIPDNADSTNISVSTRKANQISVSLRSSKLIKQEHISSKESLKSALDSLYQNWENVQIDMVHPKPRRTISEKELSMSLVELAIGSDSISLVVVNNEIDKSGKLVSDLFKRKSKVMSNEKKVKQEKTSGKSSKRRGTHTLFSTGILSTEKKKNNEYFGGDSTVFLSAEEDNKEEDGEEKSSTDGDNSNTTKKDKKSGDKDSSESKTNKKSTKFSNK